MFKLFCLLEKFIFIYIIVKSIRNPCHLHTGPDSSICVLAYK